MKKVKVTQIYRMISLAVIGIVLVISLYPILWLVLSSFKENSEFSLNPVYALPEHLNLENYAEAWNAGKMSIFFKNSVIVTLTALVLIVLAAVPVSFALSKMRWKMRRAMSSYFMLGILIPIQVVLIPLFNIYKSIGLLNTRTGLVFLYAAFGLSMTILMFTGFFESLPDELMESAVIDGCSIYGVLGRIMLPLMGNSIVTVLTLQFLGSWNDLLFAQTFLSDTKLKTVQVGLMMFSDAHGGQDWGPMFASMAIGVLPTLILYGFLSKFMIKGMTAGAVKG